VKIEELAISEIIPYEKNPRKNKKAIDYVANSIKEFGFKQPIVVDANNIIVAGHTRYEASKKLGLKSVPVHVAKDLTDEQIKAYRLADNKTAEFSVWDNDLLLGELGDISFDMTVFGFDKIFEKEQSYTEKIDGAIYEPSDDEVNLDDLADFTKYDELVAKIDREDVTDDVKSFLRWGAVRHIVFDYQRIADYYAQADEKIQELIEDSILVIVDYEKAIENGLIEIQRYADELNE
jgi:uncharacterized protein (UPF0262 family)